MGFTLIILCSLSMWNHNNCIGADLTQKKFSMSFSRSWDNQCSHNLRLHIVQNKIIDMASYFQCIEDLVYKTFSSDTFLPQLLFCDMEHIFLPSARVSQKMTRFTLGKLSFTIFCACQICFPNRKLYLLFMIGTKTPFSSFWTTWCVQHNSYLPYIVDWYIIQQCEGHNRQEWGQCSATRGNMVPCKEKKDVERDKDRDRENVKLLFIVTKKIQEDLTSVLKSCILVDVLVQEASSTRGCYSEGTLSHAQFLTLSCPVLMNPSSSSSSLLSPPSPSSL